MCDNGTGLHRAHGILIVDLYQGGGGGEKGGGPHRELFGVHGEKLKGHPTKYRK
jgi:hypothetical protein